jgi:nickel superoxide dismutase
MCINSKTNPMKTTILSASIILLALSSAPMLSAHCQVPCGIYADDNVFATMHKDQETIAKAMQQITELSKDPAKNANQLTRWINNKEKHAQSIQDTVAQYFLAQRIKITEADKEAYAKKLTLLHQITVYAMKCKQTTDLENAKKLHTALDQFHAAYAKK